MQGYLTGVGGGDVTPEAIDWILDDLATRDTAGPPVWVGITDAAEGDVQ
jgi:hypothetical protein